MKRVSENEVFVTLIRVAEEDPAVRQKLLEILAQPPTHRKSVLNFYIDQMKRKGAPPEFVTAVACLLEDKVADRALSFLREKESGDRVGT